MLSLNIDVSDPLTGELVHAAVELAARTAYVAQVIFQAIYDLYDRNRPTSVEDNYDLLWAARQGI